METAAQIGDEADQIHAAAKIKVPADKRKDADEDLQGYAAMGRATPPSPTGDWKEAMDVIEDIYSSVWQESVH